MRFFPRFGLLVAGLAASGACGDACSRASEPADDQQPEPHSGWYRAEVEGELGAVPFYLYLPGPDDDGEVRIKQGPDPLGAEHTWRAHWIDIEFPHWATTIEAEIVDDGALEGVWIGSRPFDAPETAFSATPVEEPDPHALFSERAEPGSVDVAGTWEGDFTRSGDAKLHLKAPDEGLVEGTIVQRKLSGGDFGSLTGNLRGDALFLSAFDGQKAIRLEATVEGGGAMSGEFEFVGIWRESFSAERTEAAERPAPRAGVVELGDDTQAVEIPGLDDPRYDDVPVIVALFGTWCTTCGDHAPAVRELRDRFEDDGLEIHGVAYEGVDDQDYIDEQLGVYRERYDVDWPIVSVPGPIDESLPPALAELDVLPITLFRNADGSIHAIRAGFVGKALEDAHEAQLEEFEALAREIASSGD